MYKRQVLVAVQDRWYGRLELDWFQVLPILVVLNHATLVLEALAPVLLWIRGVGKWWALGLMSLHAGLEIFANVGWWQPVMILALLSFLPVAWVAPLIEWPRSLGSRSGTPASAVP